MTRKNADYWAGYDAEAARLARPVGLETLADQVARGLRRDNAVKQRILDRSPQLYFALDAQELGEMSGRELAARELRELGIEVGDQDPLALLDAHHSGRQWARDRILPGNALVGDRGSAHDSASDSFVDKYLDGS